MTEFWFCCEDLERNVEDQEVAFGPFKDHREAHAFGWGLAYSNLDGTYCSPSIKDSDDLGRRLKILINPQDLPQETSSKQWDERTIWPSEEPLNEHEDSGYQCGKDLADDRC